MSFSFIFFVTVLFNSTTFAAQWARVTSEKAVIYSDHLMSSSIGYIRKGQKLRVGSVLKNKARVLPVIVSDKVAYIRVSDIHLANNISDLKIKSDRYHIVNEKKTILRRIGGFYNYALTTSINDFEDISLGTQGFGLVGYYDEDEKSKHYRMSLEQSSTTGEDFELSLLSVAASKVVYFLRSEDSFLSLYFGGSLIPFSEFKVGDLFTLNGYGAGAHLGFEYYNSVIKKIGFHFDVKYDYNQLMGMELPENTLYEKTLTPTITALRVGVFLSYTY